MDDRHRPFLPGPADEQRPHRRFDTGAIFTPDLIEPEQLYHPFEHEFSGLYPKQRFLWQVKSITYTPTAHQCTPKYYLASL